MPINLLLANASSSLNPHLGMIKSAYDNACTQASKDIGADQIDVVVVDAAYNAIPELGVGGYTPSAHIVYLSLDPAHDIKETDIYMGMLHEIHHAMRWRDPGYGLTLEEALYTEGLAALYEEEVTQQRPIYTMMEFTEAHINLAKKDFENSSYDHHMWFISGNAEIPRWFGYSYGYQLAKSASKKLTKSAAELVHAPVDILK